MLQKVFYFISKLFMGFLSLQAEHTEECNGEWEWCKVCPFDKKQNTGGFKVWNEKKK